VFATWLAGVTARYRCVAVGVRFPSGNNDAVRAARTIDQSEPVTQPIKAAVVAPDSRGLTVGRIGPFGPVRSGRAGER
jgi:hypothetical protein